MSTKGEARAAVLAIAPPYGFLKRKTLETLERLNPEARLEIEKVNIYGSGARFTFELLQNADDNTFARATAGGELPSITFDVFPGRILIECNEDGFSTDDLKVICTVGQSTKSGQYGYIGAKGIGFKSVFIAARKVHIQSGHFSFYFNHEKGNTGLGMVNPIRHDEDESIPGPLTRMTLYLH